MRVILESLISRGNLQMERAAVLQATMPEVIAEIARSRKELRSVLVEWRISLNAIRERWIRREKE
jgi:hypothetical protein